MTKGGIARDPERSGALKYYRSSLTFSALYIRTGGTVRDDPQTQTVIIAFHVQAVAVLL